MDRKIAQAQPKTKTREADKIEIPRPRGFSLSREEILADVRRAPRAYVRALKVDTDGE